MAFDPDNEAHREWLGYVQPVGLVVSAPALLAAAATVNRNIAATHREFLEWVNEVRLSSAAEPVRVVRDLAGLLHSVFQWQRADFVGAEGAAKLPETLEIPLTNYEETLRPTYAVPSVPADDGRDVPPFQMLIQVLPNGTPLDELLKGERIHWEASPQARFERLLRGTAVPIGLLANGTHLRLVYAPSGESSGHATFSVSDMSEVPGRPIFAALHMLLEQRRLFTGREKNRLPWILAESRRYQNTVSTKLAQQVLAALYELLRGFQSADEQRRGELLRGVLQADPNQVYAGLLAVLMRLVFTLFAEDRDLLSKSAIYTNHYSLTGLFERLRADDGQYHETMDSRYGAWAQLLALFRVIHDGAAHGDFHLPARHGHLFDPNRHAFLEGRPLGSKREWNERIEPPLVSDGVVFRVLQNLLILDGERLSYRTLDVEQIGSVYETMMGFLLQVAAGRSIALKPKKAHGAPVAVNLDALLAVKGSERAKWLKEQADQELTGAAATLLKVAQTTDDLLAAVEKKIDRRATPQPVPIGAMLLQPSDERRRSGSHYTPRSLTGPIVRTTLKPILEQLIQARSASECIADASDIPSSDKLPSESQSSEIHSLALRACTPSPDQILALKICDPAMGSAAFLVETCRQLGDELVKAWHVHNCLPKIPPDEDEVLHARRLITQRCLYGVDRNPMAVDLAKLSLWLATLAKDHPFTFLDHALRHGDSLVGLTKEQIVRFHWQPVTASTTKPNKGNVTQIDMFADPIAERMQRVTKFRQQILAARDDMPYEHLRQQLDLADEQLWLARLAGDLVVSAYFSADKDAKRERRLDELSPQLVKYISPSSKLEDRVPLTEAVKELRSGDRPIVPFHWWIEFPEVFDRENGGFDGIVGNPPFLGVLLLHRTSHPSFTQYLRSSCKEAGGKCDLVAFFFRRAFALLRVGGCLGLLATNTIAQGDTRESSLTWICNHSGTIFNATKRFVWPGVAAVVVSVVHIAKNIEPSHRELNGTPVALITAFLFHTGGHDSPRTLQANANRSFKGCDIYSPGFTFDVTDNDGTTGTIEEMESLLGANTKNAERIFPYMGGEDVLNSPTLSPHRYVIDFDDMSEEEARQWPDLIRIVETRVRPEREALSSQQSAERLRRFWWQFGYAANGMRRVSRESHRILMHPFYSGHLAFVFLPTNVIVATPNTVFATSENHDFAILQSRVHEAWVRFVASSFKDDLRYSPTDCFETFPFPVGVPEHAAGDSAPPDNRQRTSLEIIGRDYYEFRAALMVRHNEGLTKTYNRFHDRDHDSTEPNREIVVGIQTLRELHAAMDRAVLEAYGWHDLAQTATCEFLLDYEDDDEDDEPTSRARTRKKPWRYRWPDPFRDEVLARLLDLNKQRAEQERLTGIAAEAVPVATKKVATTAKPVRKKSGKKTTTADDSTDGLFERERERFYVLMLLRAWNKPVTRHALNAGLFLMLNDEIRAGVLGTSKQAKPPTAGRVVEGLDYVLQEMETLGYVQIGNAGAQQVLTILPKAPPTNAALAEDVTRIAEVKQFFDRERDRGNVMESEEHIDAKPDLVFAG